MSENKNKLKVTMQVIVGLSAAGVATVMHHAPASAETYTTAPGGYVPSDYTGTETYTTVEQVVTPVKVVRDWAPDYWTTQTVDTIVTHTDPIKEITGTSRGEVIKQITSAQSTLLTFGKVVPSSVSGVVVVNPNGSINSSGGTRYIPNSGATNAILSFSGDDGQAIQIDKPSSVVLANGENSMALTFSYGTIPTSIPATGNVAVNYGGSLAVGANQAPGIYTGTYDFFVTYV